VEDCEIVIFRINCRENDNLIINLLGKQQFVGMECQLYNVLILQVLI